MSAPVKKLKPSLPPNKEHPYDRTMDIFTAEEQTALTANPHTKRLVENFLSLQDFLLDSDTLNSHSWFQEYIYRTKIQTRYNELLEEQPTSNKTQTETDTDPVITEYVNKIVDMHMDTTNHEYYNGQDIYCREVILFVLILYKYHKLVTGSTEDTAKYSTMHSLFLTPLFNHHVFRDYCMNPLLMRFMFLCCIHSTIPDVSDPILDGQLDAFYQAILKTGHTLYAEFLRRQAEKTAIYKEELIAAAWHPRRVEKWLETGGFELLEAL
jgi:hypothetical protein